MDIFEWENSLSMGIEELDAQHKGLIKKLNDLAEAVLNRKGNAEIIRTIKFMEKYANEHFSEEEEYMERHEYPGLEHQKKEHERFRNVVGKLREELESEGASEAHAASMQRYLIDWLILHIKSTDLQFGAFMRGEMGQNR
jgi:hemerythrin